MISPAFSDVHSKEWIELHVPDSIHELIVLRKIIPWDTITSKLLQFYDSKKGAKGKSLRMMTAIQMISKFRTLSDRKVISFIKENPYFQYFCNVPPDNLKTFLHPTTLLRFRNRLGVKGVKLIDDVIFQCLRKAGAIENDAALIDSSVLESNMIYPTDSRLIYDAFKKMNIWAKNAGVELWWNNGDLKKLWRASSLDKKTRHIVYLTRFYCRFVHAFIQFKEIVQASELPPLVALEAEHWIKLLTILQNQTIEKLKGETHIENRLVSLTETDARPIVKGKSHPKCEFGTTNEMAFNRQGFMVTSEILIGHPSDKTLYQTTLKLYIERMKGTPGTCVTDGNYRSAKNLKFRPEGLKSTFLGKSTDVPEEEREFCQKARSATEGFIAVAKNLRGFKKSLYRRLEGDGIWATLSQTAFNLKKFLLLYQDEAFEEPVLIKLGLLE